MITGVILTKNEEKNIVDCLDSISFCDEILVIDDYSDDRTPDLVKSYKHSNLVITQRHMQQNYAQQRNFAVEKSSNQWVLFVDADERIDEQLRVEILRSVESEQHVAYKFKRIDHMWGVTLRHGELLDLKLIRLARKDVGRKKWMGKVHEHWDIHGLVGELETPLDHYPHQSIRDFLAQINEYSSIRAAELKSQNKQTNVFEIIAYPKGKFLYNYILKKGYKDGMAGFILAVMMSFHSFLVRSKLYTSSNSRNHKTGA